MDPICTILALVQFLIMVQTCNMRTNVTLSEDVHQFASIYAASRGITLGAAIDELVRKAEAIPQPVPDIRRSANGLPCFPPTGKPLTMQMVKDAESELE
jgi:hypothetical protein